MTMRFARGAAMVALSVAFATGQELFPGAPASSEAANSVSSDTGDPVDPVPVKPSPAPKSVTMANPSPKGGVHWGPLLAQSGLFLGLQHGFRLATEKGTREEMKGPFFKDWMNAANGLKGWNDGDPPIVNYVGHPMQGAVTGYLFVHNDPAHKADVFGMNKRYWTGQMKAMAYSAAYSTQFEVGPISEASIGNIGGKPQYRAGWVDMIVTPLGGMVWQVTEDFLDRFIITPFERKFNNKVAKVLVRGGLNPSRSFANMMQVRVPWARDNRPGFFSRTNPALQ